MGVFEPLDAETVVIHHPDWDDDESVVIRPVTWAMERRAQSKAYALPEHITPADLRGMDSEAVEALLVKHTDQVAPDLCLMEQAVVSWTLRRRPNAAQQQAGERGDVMPLSAAAIAQLPPAAGAFIRQEIARTRDVVPAVQQTGPKGDDFRPSNAHDPERRLSRSGGATGLPNGPRGTNRGKDRVVTPGA